MKDTEKNDLTLNTATNHGYEWNDNEIDRLRTMAGNKLVEEIAILLGRSYFSVKWKAQTLNISLAMNEHSNEETIESPIITKQILTHRKVRKIIHTPVIRAGKTIWKKRALEYMEPVYA